MKKFKSKQSLYLLFFLAGILLGESSYAEEKLFDEEKNFRILELVPGCWTYCPAVELAIPSDYTLKELAHGVAVWGRSEDLEKIMDSNHELISEVIFSEISTGVWQTGPEEFSGEESLEESARESGFTVNRKEKLKWGNYPVLAIEGKSFEGKPFRHAWVGLNTPEGFTISMQQHAPKDDSTKVWRALIHKTQPLDEYELFWQHGGIYMQDGYSYYKEKDIAVKITVEKRKEDGLFAIMITPITPNTSFEVRGMVETYLEGNRNDEALCMRITGELKNENESHSRSMADKTVTVMYKEVDQFSFDLEEKNHPKNVKIVTKKGQAQQ